MSARFFNPWVGDNYWEGLGDNKHRVLVLGASVYCTFNGTDNERCPHFDECTDEDAQDSSAFNDCCPHPDYDDDGQAQLLEDYPANCTSRTSSRFSNAMERRFGGLLDDNDFWDCVAFAEYVQFFLPHKNTYSSNLSDRDFDAFLETLDELQPDVVVIWGDAVPEVLRESEYAVEAEDDEPWDFAWGYNEMFIRFICCTHPAFPGFSNRFPDFAEKFEKTVDCGDDNDGDLDEDEDDDDSDEDEDDDDSGEDEDDDDSGEDKDDDEGDGDDEDCDDSDGNDSGNNDGGSDSNSSRVPSDIVLGMILEHSYQRWNRGQ